MFLSQVDFKNNIIFLYLYLLWTTITVFMLLFLFCFLLLLIHAAYNFFYIHIEENTVWNRLFEIHIQLHVYI